MKVLIVVNHHREDSLNYQIKNQVEKGLKESGHEVVDTLELYKLGLKPIYIPEDDPNWLESEQRYPAEVEKEMERLTHYEAIVFVFPMFWWGMPAMLKGYVERVFTYNFAHGSERTLHLTLKKVLWVTTTGAPKEFFESTKFDDMTDMYFNQGLARYCGIKNSKVHRLYKATRNTPEAVQKLIEEAYQEGLDFDKW